MASLGSLVVKVGADIASFQSDMGRAAKIADKKSAQMKKHMVGAAKAIAAGAALAGAAVTKMVKDSLRDADRFQKMAIAIGASTEALSQLEFAAQQSGADFESVAKGMGKLQKSIGDANNGLMTQKRAFEALGVSTEELKKLTPEKQFEVMGDALKQVTNATDRTALAADIFGQRISVGLMPLLLQGSEGIQGLRQEADKLGLTLSQDAADGAAEFNDKLNTLKMFMVGFGRQITTVLLPTLTKMFDSLVSLGDASTFAADTGKFLANMLKVVVSAGIILKNVFEAASKVMVAFAVVVINSFKALISPITAFVRRVGEAFDELSRGNFKRAAEAMGNITGDVKRQFTEAGNKIANVASDLIPAALTDLKEGFEGVIDVWDETADVAENRLAPAMSETIVDAAQETTEELEEIIVTAERMGLTFEQTADDSAVAMKEITTQSTGVAAVIENTFKRMDDVFQTFWSDLIKNGKFSMKGIKDNIPGIRGRIFPWRRWLRFARHCRCGWWWWRYGCDAWRWWRTSRDSCCGLDCNGSDVHKNTS
jgi:methyl-accepting chemotaxis protein